MIIFKKGYFASIRQKKKKKIFSTYPQVIRKKKILEETFGKGIFCDLVDSN